MDLEHLLQKMAFIYSNCPCHPHVQDHLSLSTVQIQLQFCQYYSCDHSDGRLFIMFLPKWPFMVAQKSRQTNYIDLLRNMSIPRPFYNFTKRFYKVKIPIKAESKKTGHTVFSIDLSYVDRF